MISFLPTLLLIAASKTAAAPTLTLSEYLEQVKKSHQGFLASQLRTEGAKKESYLARLYYSPQLFAKSAWASDARQTTNLATQGDKTITWANSVGLQKTFSSGTIAKVGYELDYTSVKNASSISQPKHYDGSPYLEIAQPLWRNFFGSETRASTRAIEAQFLELSFLEQYKLKQILIAAELAYWKYYAATLTIAIREQTLDRAKKLRDWTQNRVQRSLADRSDFLQSDAALKGRQFEIEQTKDNARSLATTFNTFRGVESTEVTEKLARPSPEELARLDVPQRTSLRADVQAADQHRRYQNAQAEQTMQKGTPSLDLTGALGLHSRKNGMDDALSNSFNRDHNTYAIGVNLNIPLDIVAMKDVRAGAQKEQKAAQLDYERKFFEQEQEWRDLTLKFAELKKRLSFARELENAQKEKARYEQDRLHRGRTTTYQVLVFEDDYETAQLNLLQNELELMTTLAQLKIFAEGL